MTSGILCNLCRKFFVDGGYYLVQREKKKSGKTESPGPYTISWVSIYPNEAPPRLDICDDCIKLFRWQYDGEYVGSPKQS